MSERNYYWLKLMKDFFTQPKIKKLRKIAGGDTYTIIYLKLQLLSLDNDAVIKFEHIEDTLEDELALTIDEDVDNVSVTLNYMLSQGLIEKISENEYLLKETLKLIGSETSVAKRVRKYREKQKALLCNTDVTNCNTEIDIDTDKELDKKKKETYVSILGDYTSNQILYDAILGFIEMRKKQKGFTTRAFKLALNKLDTLANDDDTKIEIVNQSVMNGWKSFYQLKNNGYQNKELPTWYEQTTDDNVHDVDDEELKRMQEELRKKME